MPGEKLSHTATHTEEDRLGGAEQDYWALDLANHPASADIAHGNGTILEAYQAGAEPEADPETIRNRAISRYTGPGRAGTLAGDDWVPVITGEGENAAINEDNLRALQFAADAAAPCNATLRDLETRTETPGWVEEFGK